MVGAISFALACYLILAPWQFGRNAERSEQNAAVAAAITAPPVPIAERMSTTVQPNRDAIWRRVTVTGTFDASREAYIRLRQDGEGRPASEVVVPLITADGTAVLVDRGYVSFASVQQGSALPALPTGTVTLTGRVQADQTDPKNRPPVAAPDGRMQYTAASSALAAPGPVYRGYLQLTEDSPGVIDPIGLPQQDSGPFFSYALQWLAFGAIAVLGIGYFIYREVTDPAAEDIYLSDEGSASGDGGSGGIPDDESSDNNEGPGGDNGSNGDARAPSDTPTSGDGHLAERRPSSRRRTRRGFDKSQLYDRD